MSAIRELVAELPAQQAQQVKELMDRGVKIPPQPQVVEEMRRLMRDGGHDLRLMAKAIGRDPGLVGLLFKAVQTPAYRQYQPFDSIEGVLQAIGINQTFNIVQAVSLGTAISLKDNRAALEAFWARTQVVSQLSMLVAGDRVSVCNIFPDQAYMAGVFHDCGVPVLMQRFPTYCSSLHLDQPGRWTDLKQEDRRFGADHCVVGYIVARHWRLPSFVCEAIRLHHEIDTLDMHAARTMVAILQLATHAYERIMGTQSPEWNRVGAEVVEELGLHEDDAGEYVDDLIERYQEAYG
jgi:HD-like signal output (HDOD) protein